MGPHVWVELRKHKDEIARLYKLSVSHYLDKNRVMYSYQHTLLIDNGFLSDEQRLELAQKIWECGPHEKRWLEEFALYEYEMLQALYS